MKYYLLLILYLSFSAFIYCQETKVIVTIEDNSGNSDSVIIGKSFDATTGIDVAYNEENVFNSVFSDPEIRSIHRTQANHECLNSSLHNNSGDPLFFEDDRDLKIDYRDGSLFASEANCFELNFVASNYPLKLKFNTTTLPGPSHGYWIGLYDSTCTLFQGSYLLDIITEYEITDASITKIILKKDHEVRIENDQTSQFKIIMNGGSFRILNLKNTIHSILLYDNSGKLLIRKDITLGHEVEINLNDYSDGLYFLLISNENGDVLTTKKILKIK